MQCKILVLQNCTHTHVQWTVLEGMKPQTQFSLWSNFSSRYILRYKIAYVHYYVMTKFIFQVSFVFTFSVYKSIITFFFVQSDPKKVYPLDIKKIENWSKYFWRLVFFYKMITDNDTLINVRFPLVI